MLMQNNISPTTQPSLGIIFSPTNKIAILINLFGLVPHEAEIQSPGATFDFIYGSQSSLPATLFEAGMNRVTRSRAKREEDSDAGW